MRQLKINHSITNRESKSLDKYLQEISKIDLLSAEEEVELATNIKKWDQKSLEKLAKANLRFVVSVAKQYQGQWLSLNDLINEGNIWLIKAAQKFDETKWFKFISYAVWWIRQSILQAIAEQSRVVRLPLNKLWDVNKINRESSKFEQEYEREPTAEELAEILDKDAVNIKLTQDTGQHHVSLYNTLNWYNDDIILLDTMSDSSTEVKNVLSIENDYASKKLEIYFKKLNQKQQLILKMYYGIWYNDSFALEDIASFMWFTRERARQIKDKGINRLRHLIERDPDKRMLIGVLQR